MKLCVIEINRDRAFMQNKQKTKKKKYVYETNNSRLKNRQKRGHNNDGNCVRPMKQTAMVSITIVKRNHDRNK